MNNHLMLSRNVVFSIIAAVLLLLTFYPGKVKSSDAYADSLLNIINTLPDNSEKVDQLIKLSRRYYRIDYDSALFYCSLAEKVSDRIGYAYGEADVMYIRSLVFKQRNDLDRAQECLDRFIEISSKLEDSIRLAKGYFQQGNLLGVLGNYNMSILYFKKSLAVYLPLKDTHAIVANYNSIANYYKNKAEYDSASSYYMMGIDLTEIQRDELKLSILYRNLGDNYLMAMHLDAARLYFTRSLELNKKLSNREREIGHNYNCLARVSVEEMKYKEALVFYQKAEMFFDKIDYQLGLIDLDNNYGDLHFRKNEYDLALQYFDKALVKYRELGYQSEFVITLTNKAATLSEMGNFTLALQLYDTCLMITTAIGNREKRMDILGNIAILYDNIGNYKLSNDYLKKHYSLKDSIFNIGKTQIINELMLKYEKEKDQARLLKMEKDHLEKDIVLERRTQERNSFFYGGLGVVVFIVFIFSFYSQRIRKNRIIAEQRIVQLEEEKKLLAARSIVEGQEEERKRIARELHDGLGVLLSSARMHFTTVRDRSPDAKPLIDKAAQLLEQATGDVRRISHNMMPGLLTRYGFYEAVEDLLEQVDDMEDVGAVVKINGDQTRLNENKEIMLYRIIQEMVNNTLKHAEAKKIKLEMNIQQDRLHIDYSDDGKGFKFEDKIRDKSMGLTNLQSRVKFLGGELEFDSRAGTGVKYSFEVGID